MPLPSSAPKPPPTINAGPRPLIWLDTAVDTFLAITLVALALFALFSRLGDQTGLQWSLNTLLLAASLLLITLLATHYTRRSLVTSDSQRTPTAATDL